MLDSELCVVRHDTLGEGSVELFLLFKSLLKLERASSLLLGEVRVVQFLGSFDLSEFFACEQGVDEGGLVLGGHSHSLEFSLEAHSGFRSLEVKLSVEESLVLDEVLEGSVASFKFVRKKEHGSEWFVSVADHCVVVVFGF